jgi:hypothetical protein
VLAVAFGYLSIDEMTEVHEQAITPLKQLFALDGVLSFSWIVLAVPLTAVFGLLMVGYLRALPRRFRRAFLLAGALYVGGAAGVEMIGALLWSRGDLISTAYVLSVTVEEGLEMVSIVIFLRAVTLLRLSTTVDPALPDSRPSQS